MLRLHSQLLLLAVVVIAEYPLSILLHYNLLMLNVLRHLVVQE